MFKRILPGLLSAFALLLDLSILPLFTATPYMPQFSLITVLCLGLLLGRTRGLTHGLVAGLVVDILVASPMGLQTILYILVGYAGGIFGRTFTRHPLTPLIAASVCFLVYEIACYVYIIFATFDFHTAALLTAFVRMLIHIGGAQALFYLYEVILKPSRSRYAPR